MTSTLFLPARKQDGYWLGAERAQLLAIIVISAYLVAAVVWVVRSDGMLDPGGKPLGYDFVTFWAASKMALNGDFLAIYDKAQFFALQREIAPGTKSLFLWNYPPQFVLVVMPLALAPYGVAFFAWTLAAFAFFLAVVHRFAPAPTTLLLAAAFPATFWNMTHGQNGLLLAALFGGAMLLLERRPVLAGVLIGLMTFKPHLGLLIPIALLFGRQWTAFAAAAATATVFALAGTAVVGVDAWDAFLRELPAINGLLENGKLPWKRMVSAFSSLRMLGARLELAYAVQVLSALAAATGVALVWSRTKAPGLRAAVLAAGAPLATPYVFDYDLAMLAVPMAAIAWDGMQRGWLSGERKTLIAVWLAPILATVVAANTGIPLGYPCVLALFLVAVRRALAPAVAFQGESVA